MSRFLRLVRALGLPMGVTLFIVSLVPVGFYAMASADVGPYTVNGARVAKTEFLSYAGPVLGGYLIMSLSLSVRRGAPYSVGWSRWSGESPSGTRWSR